MSWRDELGVDGTGVAVERSVQLRREPDFSDLISLESSVTHEAEPRRGDVHLALGPQTAKGQEEADAGVNGQDERENDDT